MENPKTNLKCRKCGAIISSDQKKCPKCGAPVLLKVMLEEEKHHLPAKEIREKDKRMRREYDKISKEKEQRRVKSEKKQQRLDDKKEKAERKAKAELEIIKAKEAAKAAKAEKAMEKKAQAEKAAAEAAEKKASEPRRAKNKSSLLAIILIIVAILAAGAVTAYFLTQRAPIEQSTEPEPQEEVLEEVSEEAEEEAEEEVEEEVEEVVEEEQHEEIQPEVKKQPEQTPPKTSEPVRNITQNSYIFPSDSQYITESDLEGRSRTDIGLMRNEIYARKGFVFKTEFYRDYFNSQAWYTPNPNAKMNLNEFEKYNADFLLEYERSQGWR